MRNTGYSAKLLKMALIGTVGFFLSFGFAIAQEGESNKKQLDVEGAQNAVPISELPEGSPQAKALKKEIDTNFDFMTSKAISKAGELLEDYGKFYPFGVAVGPEGKMNFAWTVSNDKKNSKIDPRLALAALRKTLAANATAKRLLATAIVYEYARTDDDGNIIGKQVNVELEYVTGAAKVRAAPFKILDDGSVKFMGMGEQEMESRVFSELLSKMEGVE
ncbi:hypothetical protein QQM79_01585 [Marinobacteraceae bacterium S3BR75-40.1]